MRRFRIPLSVIVSAYGCLLLLLAVFFLMGDQAIHRPHSSLPVHFLMKFGTFWFISFVLALVICLASVNSMSASANRWLPGTAFSKLVLGLLALVVLAALTLVAFLNY